MENLRKKLDEETRYLATNITSGIKDQDLRSITAGAIIVSCRIMTKKTAGYIIDEAAQWLYEWTQRNGIVGEQLMEDFRSEMMAIVEK